MILAKPFYRVRISGWLYITGYKQLSPVLEAASEYDHVHDAITAARLLGRDEECTIIENKHGKVTFHDLQELEYAGK